MGLFGNIFGKNAAAEDREPGEKRVLRLAVMDRYSDERKKEEGHVCSSKYGFLTMVLAVNKGLKAEKVLGMLPDAMKYDEIRETVMEWTKPENADTSEKHFIRSGIAYGQGKYAVMLYGSSNWGDDYRLLELVAMRSGPEELENFLEFCRLLHKHTRGKLKVMCIYRHGQFLLGDNGMITPQLYSLDDRKYLTELYNETLVWRGNQNEGRNQVMGAGNERRNRTVK